MPSLWVVVYCGCVVFLFTYVLLPMWVFLIAKSWRYGWLRGEALYQRSNDVRAT